MAKMFKNISKSQRVSGVDSYKRKNAIFKEFLKYNTANRYRAQLYIFIHQQWIKKEGLMTETQVE